MHVLLAEKAELERDLKDSGDKLSSALAECNAKDDLVKKHSNTAKEALAGSLHFSSFCTISVLKFHLRKRLHGELIF